MNSVSFLSCIEAIHTYFQYRLFWSKLIFCACMCFIVVPAFGQTTEGDKFPQEQTAEIETARKKKSKKTKKKRTKKSKKTSSDKIGDIFWVNKSKQYAKDPMSLKVEIEAYRKEIEEMKAQNKALEAEERDSYIKIDSLKHAVGEIKREITSIEEENDEIKQVLKTYKAVQRAGIKQGLIYRIVLFEASIEEDDSAFGEFRKEEEAQKFLANLRRLGFNADVNILPYIDGKRVSDEAVKAYGG